MRRTTLVLLLVCPFFASSQFVAGYHQSNLSFAAIGYEFKERFRPELRLSVNVFDEDFSPEAVFLFDILNKENYEFYVGAGVRLNLDEGLVVPVGLNIYPLPSKQFGFHIELAPIFNDFTILRGSWGIRYRFLPSR
jgi:hypothetical protein